MFAAALFKLAFVLRFVRHLTSNLPVAHRRLPHIPLSLPILLSILLYLVFQYRGKVSLARPTIRPSTHRMIRRSLTISAENDLTRRQFSSLQHTLEFAVFTAFSHSLRPITLLSSAASLFGSAATCAATFPPFVSVKPSTTALSRIGIHGFKPKLCAHSRRRLLRRVPRSHLSWVLRPSGSIRWKLVTDFAVNSLLAFGRIAKILFGSFPRITQLSKLPKPQGFNHFHRCRRVIRFLEPQKSQELLPCRQQVLARRTTLVGFFPFCLNVFLRFAFWRAYGFASKCGIRRRILFISLCQFCLPSVALRLARCRLRLSGRW